MPPHLSYARGRKNKTTKKNCRESSTFHSPASQLSAAVDPAWSIERTGSPQLGTHASCPTTNPPLAAYPSTPHTKGNPTTNRTRDTLGTQSPADQRRYCYHTTVYPSPITSNSSYLFSIDRRDSGPIGGTKSLKNDRLPRSNASWENIGSFSDARD
ncbi:unnamed protein product, partial [Ectocarpus sp. 4 AP-2014]